MSRRLRTACAVVAAAAGLAVAIVLVSGGGSAKPVVPECAGAGEVDIDCQERRYVKLAETSGAAAALQDLGDHVKDSGYLRAACHRLTHRIGRTAGATAGIGAFAKGDPLCASGYYHGVTEAVMNKIGPVGAVRDAPAVCADLRPRTVDYSNCIHGMGHGYMHVLGRKLGASLQGCDGLRASRERHGCYSGVFMENLASIDEPSRGSLRPNQPLYPCTVVARRYKPECYDRQTTYALFISDGDFKSVFRLCAKTDRKFRGACRRGLGGDVAAETKVIDGKAVQARSRRRLCLLGDGSKARSDCVTGAVGVILQDLEGGPAQLDAFCASLEAVATQPEHAACLRASEKAYGELLAQQTGEDFDQGAQAGGLDFVCHLKKPGRRRRSS